MSPLRQTPPNLQIVLDDDWPRYTRLLSKDCTVLSVVYLSDENYSALVRLATTRELAKVNGVAVAMLNTSQVRKMHDLSERKEHSPALQIVTLY